MSIEYEIVFRDQKTDTALYYTKCVGNRTLESALKDAKKCLNEELKKQKEKSESEQ